MMTSALLLLAILAAPGHPGLYETPADVARARANIQRFEWARAYFDEVQKGADKWAAKSEKELRDLVPPPGSKFAYGFSGCPVCGANWYWWGAGGVASVDAPRKAACPTCKRTFPDADHPDSGNGWKSPKDGKTYYFVGCYNAFVVQEITLHALQSLSTAYAVTGDRKYSRAAAALLDRLADTYPTCIEGSIDYPEAQNTGRLERPQYQVARVLVFLADYLDLLYDSPEFAAPSASGKGSVRQHVEESIIRDGGKYCYDKTTSGIMGLTNGQADYVRGALAAGIMLNDKQWIDCALTGPYRLENFLANCLDRDGQYYESSVGYGDHCLTLYIDMAEMLYNLRTPEHPNGINFYNHPKLQKALFAGGIDITCLGHTPRFGDWGPDFGVINSDSRFLSLPYRCSEYLAARAGSKDSRDYWAAAREYICDGNVESQRAGKSGVDMRWMLFHADPAPKTGGKAKLDPHPVLGGRGTAILRTGQSSKDTAALLRYGPSLNHGHYDDLGLNYYALGREVTYDLGYDLGSSHTLVGWSKQTASHNLVVVNEKSQMLQDGGSGSAQLYVDAAPVRVFEGSSEASYASEKVKDYRRQMVLANLPGGGLYMLDIFRVSGGKQHDQMWHFFGKLDKVEGAEFGETQKTGSLAGPDIDWGRKVGPAGYLIGCADKGDYWNPPPGNGYGFLYNVTPGKATAKECKATWAVNTQSKDTVTLWMLPESGTQIITAQAPGILPDYPKADYAILRRKGADLSSAFISVIEASAGTPGVKSVKRLESSNKDAVGVVVESANAVDYILSSASVSPAVFKTDAGDIRLVGRFGFLRVINNKVERGVLAGGIELSFGSYKLASKVANYMGVVAGVNYNSQHIKLDSKLPSEFTGQYIYLNRSAYSHNSPYKIRSVDEDGFGVTLDTDMVLSRGQIGDGAPKSPDAIANVVPLPRATTVPRRESNYFNGKLIINDRTGASSVITRVENDQRTIHVKDPGKFTAGDAFTIYDIQTGDTAGVPIVVKS